MQNKQPTFSEEILCDLAAFVAWDVCREKSYSLEKTLEIMRSLRGVFSMIIQHSTNEMQKDLMLQLFLYHVCNALSDEETQDMERFFTSGA